MRLASASGRWTRACTAEAAARAAGRSRGRLWRHRSAGRRHYVPSSGNRGCTCIICASKSRFPARPGWSHGRCGGRSAAWGENDLRQWRFRLRRTIGQIAPLLGWRMIWFVSRQNAPWAIWVR